MRRAGALAALTLGIAALSAVSASAASAAGPAGAAVSAASPASLRTTLTWTPCTDEFLASVGAECSTVTVPIDYAHPSGPTATLALSRVRHTSPEADYRGAVLVNAGGQGLPGRYLSITGAYVPNGGGAAYDWIGFDPRGTAAATPALSCAPDYYAGPRPPYTPASAGDLRAWTARTRAYARSCAARNGSLVGHLSTADSARDLDRIRVALGLPRISYYGFSYGTYLGEVYSSLYPARTDRLILDSAVDPRGLWQAPVLGRAPQYDANLNAWFAWIAGHDSTYGLGTTAAAVRATYLAEQKALTTKPAGGSVGPAEWTEVFLPSAVYQHIWPEQAATFAAWVHSHEADPLVAAYVNATGPGDDNSYAGTLAPRCEDQTWTGSVSGRLAAAAITARKAPLSAWQRLWTALPCLWWPTPAGARPVPIDGRDVHDALLVHETEDAPIAYAGSLEVRRRYPGARLIAEPGGTSDGATLFGNTCTDDAIADYLATGALPARKPGDTADVSCAPLPPPSPAAAVAPAAIRAAAARPGA